MARAGNPHRIPVDDTEHIEIDQTVVERRNERISERMRQSPEITVAPGGIDQNEAVRFFKRIDLLKKRVAVCRLVLDGRMVAVRYEVAVIRNFKVEPGLLRPGMTVLDIMGEALLPGVEIESGDAVLDLRSAIARCIATVDLPEPPFSLPTTITRARGV
jgi:hypothetical protein